MSSATFSMEELSQFIKQRRKSLGLSQAEIAKSSNLGVRFIGDLERGKPTCEIGKVLQVLAALSIELQLTTSQERDK